MATVSSTEDSNYFSSSLPCSHSDSNLSHPSSAPLSSSATQPQPTGISFSSTVGSEVHFDLPLVSQDKFSLLSEFWQEIDLEPPPNPMTGQSCTNSSIELEELAVSSGLDSPRIAEHAEDDIAVSSGPSQQVDYLSHDWKEDDIWSSLRYVKSNKGDFANIARLENALWRNWMKVRNNLRTILPEELNWLKDYDVTWLYGPLRCGPNTMNLAQPKLVFTNKKSILKRKAMSEVMLQKSLLSVPATSDVSKYETNASGTECCTLDVLYTRRERYGTRNFLAQSTASSLNSSTAVKRRYIHFSDQVEQYMAIDIRDDGDFNVEQARMDNDLEPDNCVLGEGVRSQERPSSRSRNEPAISERRTITKLPSITLKSRGDILKPWDNDTKHRSGVCRNSVISPSPCQRSYSSTKKWPWFVSGRTYEEHEGRGDGTWIISSDSLSPSMVSIGEEISSSPRTPSGKSMTCEEGGARVGVGFNGSVTDSINAARNIAHVIWNVGLKR